MNDKRVTMNAQEQIITECEELKRQIGHAWTRKEASYFVDNFLPLIVIDLQFEIDKILLKIKEIPTVDNLIKEIYSLFRWYLLYRMVRQQPRTICTEIDFIRDMLLEKNQAYGNSALDPIRVFSKADPIEQIKVRIDDKLSRLFRGSEFANEDTVLDLLGYLVLLLVTIRSEG